MPTIASKDIVPISLARARLTELAEAVSKSGQEKVFTRNGESYVALITAGQLDEVTRKVRSYNPSAAIIATERCAGVEALLFTGARGGKKPPAAADPGHGAALQSFVYTTDSPMQESRFSAWADSLAPQVYRAKGFVILDSGSYLFNFVAGRWELEGFVATTSQLVFIGRDLLARRDDIVNGLKQCERHDELPLH